MKKVLIITYYWPPAGGPGVQRWLKFVKYLPDHGIEPIVYVPENAHYPLKDPSLEAEIPKNIKVLKKPIFEPYGLAGLLSKKSTNKISSGIIPEKENQGAIQKLMLFIRGNLFIPDARKFWIKPSVNFLTEFIREHEIDTIITSGPPHSVHLIGLQLKSNVRINWIADFRDPWTQIGYHKELKLLPKAQRRHEQLEKEVLDEADEIITTSFITKEEFEAKTRTHVRVITNGYDYEKVDPLPLDAKFTVSHIGSLLTGRNPENLWKAFQELLAENAEFAKDFQLKLVGAVGEPVLQSIQKCDLNSWLVLKEYVSHKEALQLQRSSQLLLLVEINSQETRGIIPGKLFEYMVSNRPIMAVGPEKADIQKIIQKTNTGSYFLYSQKREMKEYLLARYAEFKRGELRSHPIGLQQYSRKNLTRELADVIKKQPLK